ncbi:MAG: phospholipase D-like domain-containing protein, partial [Myxococcota bacterium]
PTLHQLYFTAINSARERIVILNPYFVPTESLLSALIAAAHRGVDVQVILPHEGDQLLVFYASRSYYEELLKAGVRIYENDTRMVHAKVMAVDGRFCTVGSCNLDMRSFYLNFEVNALIYSKPVAERVEEVFEQILREVRPIVLDEFVRRPFHRRLAENTCRLLSPML